METPAPFRDHPAAWTPQTLRPTDWQYTLNDDQQMALSASDPSAMPKSVPGAVAAVLRTVQERLENGPGIALIRGISLASATDEQLQELFLRMAEQVGTPVSQSATGEQIFRVEDAGFGPQDVRTRGPNTSKPLSFHTDRCDVIGFLCVRKAHSGGENQVVSSVSLYNRIAENRPDLLQELMKPYFYRRHNVDLGGKHELLRQPIFANCQGHFVANYLRVLIDRAYATADVEPMSDRQSEALELLEQYANDPEMHISFEQQPGDMLFLNNFVTLHRRAGFVDHEDRSKRRLLLRVWLSVPNSRPLPTAFQANYGDTRAGAVRGGMLPLSERSPQSP